MQGSFTVSLRATHKDADPSFLTALFAPTSSVVSWKKGDARVTPHGTILEGYRDTSYWSCRIDRPETKSVDQFLLTWITEHSSRSTAISAATKAGWLISLYLILYVPGAGTAVTVNASQVRSLADCGLGFEIELFQETEM